MSNGFSLNIGSIKGQQVNVGQNITATQYNSVDNLTEQIEVLHIIGNSEFGKNDAIALKNSGIKHRTTFVDIEPYFETLSKELIRQREDNNILPYWHVSAHGQQKDGILFGKKWYNWNEFYNLLSEYDNLEILFLAACESINVADNISGLFKYIVATTIKIPNATAIKATEIFWKNINNDKDAFESFEAMQSNIPEFASHMRIRGIN